MIALDTSNHSSCVKTLTAMATDHVFWEFANVDKGGGVVVVTLHRVALRCNVA